MLAAAVIDLIFGILIGMWFGQTKLGQVIIAQVKTKIEEVTPKTK